MFERLEKPFLTVETGEAYQPIRLSYGVKQKEAVIKTLDSIDCLDKVSGHQTWNWYWKQECSTLHFDSVDSFKKNPQKPVRLGTFSLRADGLHLNLPSFKRACLAVPFFYKLFKPDEIEVSHADFINKVYGMDERLPHGFTELFNDEKLDSIIKERLEEYEKVQAACEQADNAEEALALLNEYTAKETKKRLPYAERHEFHPHDANDDPDVIFLSFYIFLRGRELVAIRRWFGNPGYTLADAADEAIEEIFGDVGIDIID